MNHLPRESSATDAWLRSRLILCTRSFPLLGMARTMIWCFCVDMALHGVEGPTGIRWESEGGLRVAAVIVVRPRTMPALTWV